MGKPGPITSTLQVAEYADQIENINGVMISGFCLYRKLLRFAKMSKWMAAPFVYVGSAEEVLIHERLNFFISFVVSCNVQVGTTSL
jgi:hypothetical protein